MPEGRIVKLVTDKGFGFIAPLNEPGSFFFHRSYISQGSSFHMLEEGNEVNFELRNSPKKLGQKEAYDVRPVRLSPNATQEIKPKYQMHSNNPTALPYGFVPVHLNRTVSDTPIWHDGSSGGDLLSGEILCELEALTPILPGNMRYQAKEANQNDLKRWGFGTVAKDKQIVEPLRLQDGRVVIAGSALKGMLRQSLGALTSAPMERVGERHFTYRPNLQFNKDGIKERYVVRPALIIAEHDGGMDIDVFDNARAALFVRNEAVTTIKEAASADGVISKMVPGVTIDRGTRILASRNSSAIFRHRLASYKGGIDGQGLLAEAFNEGRRGPFTYPLALVPQTATTTLHLDAELYHRYLQDQNAILASNGIGHLTGHPLGSKFRESQVIDAIRNNCKFSVGQLIYVELTTDIDGKVSSSSKVVSCGHHFRYRWAYTSSICLHNGQTRPCLSPISEEQIPAERKGSKDEAPESLTGARLLFGYVRHDKTNPIGQGVFERMAGRIAINHAVSDGVPRFLGNANKGNCIPLKILGQPKASAWEFYLQQPSDPEARPATYGDLPGDAGGDLSGRKFYRHQPGTTQSDIETDQDDIVNSNQATLARFICAPKTRFRFTIRFARLRKWELGALLAALEPNRLSAEDKAEDYAHKLGLGRPLGMGSVKVTRKDIRIRYEDSIDFVDIEKRDAIIKEAFVELIRKLPKGAVSDWLEMHRLVPNLRLAYPSDAEKPIYDWHTTVRKMYSQLRRQNNPNWSELNSITRQKLPH